MSALPRGCPSDLALEVHLRDTAASGLSPHLAGCERCRARLAEMERQGEEFRRFVYPATVDAVVAAARPRRWWRSWAVLLPVPALAAAAVLLLVLPRGPSDDYLGVKGGLALTVFTPSPSGSRALADGSEVPAAAALRFQVRPRAACRLWIASVDASGQVSRIYPPAGEGGAEVARPGPLPGGAVLDGKGGPERFYAVCAPGPLAWSEVERAARAAAGGGAAAVRGAGPLRGLPEGTVQETLVLEKKP